MNRLLKYAKTYRPSRAFNIEQKMIAPTMAEPKPLYVRIKLPSQTPSVKGQSVEKRNFGKAALQRN